MFLKSITLKGFKSFADRTVIDFGEGITCIVGPNGSGKSNITDAFRWVLGEQRYKTLRGKHMHDVIFSGTNQRKALGFAEVMITFDNSTHFLAIDFEEVVVTRRLYRSGESVYAINDAECRLKDVKQLFMDTGVGVEGYSIIGQGRIDSILSTNKDERRLIFEEAAGIVKYRTRKDEAERKLARVNKNLERISDIVSELELRVEPLKEQAEKALQYKGLADELKSLEINIFIHDIEAANQKIELLKQDIEMRKAELAKDEMTLTTSLSQISEYNDVIAKGEADYESDLATIGQLKSDIARLEGDIAVLKERATALVDNKQAKQKLLVDSQAELKIVNDDLVVADQTLQEQQMQFDLLQQSLKQSDVFVVELTDKLAKTTSEQQQRQAEINSLEDAISGLSQENHKMTARDEVADRQLETIAEDITNFETTIETELKKSSDYAANAALLTKQVEATKNDKNNIQQSLADTARAIAEAEDKLYQLRSQLAQDEATKKALEQQEARNEGFSFATKRVLEWSKDDSAVYGSVKDLFTIDQKFFTAVETGLGRQLQSIVVKDEDVVDDYIEQLKKHKAGRVTFIPNAQVKPRELPEQTTEKGYYGCAWYLINCRPELSNTFKFLLSGIFFTDTLNDAKRIAKTLPKGARVISLAGEVVNVGGTITGGSLSKRDTGYLARKNDIKILNKKIADQNQQLADVQAERHKKLALQVEQREQLAAIEDQIKQSNEKIVTLTQHSAASQQLLKEAERKRLQMDSEANSLRDAIGARAATLDKNLASIGDYRENIVRLQAEIADLKGQAVLHSEQLAKREAELTDYKVEVAKAQEVVKSAELKHHQLLQRKAQLESNIDNLTADLTEFDQLIKDIENNTLSTNQNLDHTSGRLIALNEKSAADKALVERTKQSLAELQKTVNAERQLLQEQKNDIFKIELDLTRIETRRESIIQNLWDSYELSYIKALDYKQDVDIKAYASRARKLKREIKQLGDVNLGAIAEYDTVKERYEFLSEQQQDLLQSNEKLVKMIREIDRQMRKTFKDKLTEINGYFKDIFSKLFGGGSGDIVLGEADDVLDAEILIQAQPPGKKLQNLELLSGGEKALTAICLLFAILKTKPTPFCILDEIEAALDDVNIYRFADFLKEFVQKSQFIIITHRKGTMEIAEYLYGVTMREQGITTMLSVELTDAQQLATN